MSSTTVRISISLLLSAASLAGPLPAAAAAPTDPAASQGLVEIVVTAQKRVEDLQAVALAVSAVTGDTLRQAGVVDPQGLTDMVPGLEVGYNNSNTTFAIRGISSTTDATLGDAAVAFHLDGVFEGRPAAASGLFYDVSRVEVLRGPQGTLYGRNATAGTINVVTNHPNFDGYSGSAQVETGNYGMLSTSAMFNAPVSETFAVRGAMQTLRHTGYLSDGYNDADNVAGRLQALWKPNDKVSLLMFADYFHQGGVGPGLTVLSNVTPCDFNQASPTYTTCTINTAGGRGQWASFNTIDMTNKGYESPSGWTNNKSWTVHAELSWNLGPFTLTEIPAYHHLEVNYFALGNSLDNFQHEAERETSNELRLSSNPGSKAQWVLGAYYHDEEQPYTQTFYDNVAGGMGAFSCAGFAPGGFGPWTSPEFVNASGNPSCAAPGQGVSLVFPYPTISNPSYALFGQLTYPVTPDTRLTGGLRWNHDRKHVVGETDRVYGVSLPAGSPDWAYIVPPVTLNGRPSHSGVLAGQTIYPGQYEVAITTNADITWSKTTWKAGIEHDLGDHHMIYGNVSTGYKQGGVFAGLAPYNTYKPESVTAFEIGSKNRFMNNRLQLNVDAFYYKYKDYQVDQLENLPADNLGNFSFGDDIFNAGRMTEFGAEMELRWVATDADEIDFNLAYLPGKFDEFTFPIQANPARAGSTVIQMIDLSGVAPTSAPDFTGTLAYRHTWTMGSGSSVAMTLQTHVESAYWLAVDHNIVATATNIDTATGVVTPNQPLTDYGTAILQTKNLGARQRGYSRSQAALSYLTSDKKFSWQAYVRNIEGKAVMNAFSFGGDGAAYASVSAPRTFGISFGAHW
jgi:iron complex outermembrane recepter protein